MGLDPNSFELDSAKSLDWGNKMQDVLERMTGQRSVPSVFIGQRFLGGFDEFMLAKRNGKLNHMLAQAGVSWI